MIQDINFVFIKFTIAISVLAIFYKLFLERITFFKSIRWYFLLGIFSSMVLALVSLDLRSHTKVANYSGYTRIAQYIPSLQEFSIEAESGYSNNFRLTTILIILYVIGFFTLVVRQCIQILSFRRIKQTAKRVNHKEGSIYITPNDITPFSFGNSIFVSHQNLELASLEKIIAHEMIHIRQYHSIDMLLAELVCILNWFNPFAWILKKSIRQNLEYLADDIMLSHGTDIKAYQYLLLQTLGHSPYSLASGFNFHSLKSRIMMMNQNKSHYLHKLKFLLLVPMIVLLLFAFRSIPATREVLDEIKKITSPADTTKPKSKRDYTVSLSHSKDGKQEKATVKWKDGRTETYNLKDKKSRTDFFAKYDMPPPPPPPPPGIGNMVGNNFSFTFSPDENDKVERIKIKGDHAEGDYATVYLKDGNKESYDLTIESAKREFEEKYGHLIPDVSPMPPIPSLAPMPSIAPMPAIPPVPPVLDIDGEALAPMAPLPATIPLAPIPAMPPMAPMPVISPLFDFELPTGASLHMDDDNKITIKFENGNTESYDMNNSEESKAFRKKYRKLNRQN